MSKKSLEIRLLDDGDLKSFREIRLEALKLHPESFLGDYEVEKQKSDTFFLRKMHRDKIVGCFHTKTGKLLGIVGYFVITPEGKRAHSAKIWGFYIRPDYRGRGFAKKMMEVLLDEIEQVAEKALLKVNARNHGVVRLYKKLGFVKYGFEARSLKIDGKYYDDFLMVKYLT